MRRFLLAVFLAAPAAAPAAQAPDWELLQTSPFHGYRFEDGSFIDPSTGFIVDPQGRTHRTTDAGATWQLRSEVGSYLRSAAFTSAEHGWVGVLFSGTRLYETSDAGATMVDVTPRIAPAIGGGICGLWAVNADTAFGVGQYSGPAYVIRTVDGGATWQSTDLSAIAGSLVDVFFFDSQRGLAVGGTAGADTGGRVLVLATEDGGATWTPRFTGSPPPTGQGEWAWKISFPTPLVGYVSVERTFGSTGKVLKTTDGGLTWIEIAVPQAGNMQGIGFLTADRGWISGRGDALVTVDGGVTWANTSSIDEQVNRFAFFGDSLGYAMGQRIYRLDARTVTSAPTPDAPALALTVMPNPSSGPVTVSYHLPRAGDATLAVFDALGRRVAVLASGAHAAGVHAATWAAADAGRSAAAVYVVRLETAGRVVARTFAVAR